MRRYSGFQPNRPGLFLGTGVLLTTAVGGVIFLSGPFGMEGGRGMVDLLFLVLLCFRIPWGARFFGFRIFPKAGRAGAGRADSAGANGSSGPAAFPGPHPEPSPEPMAPARPDRISEIFIATGTVLFLFSFIYASNANMDYVQRFAASGGNIRLAPDSFIQRLNSIILFLPPILWDWLVYFRSRTAQRRSVGKRPEPEEAMPAESVPAGTVPPAAAGGFTARWGFPLALLSGVLYALSFPSFLVPRGIPGLGFVALIPLMAAVRRAPFRWGLLEGTAGMVTGTMITNFWLGTFSLVSLQLITVVSIVWYLLLFLPLIPLARRSGTAAAFIIPCLWTLFDYLRSLGFLGYPWGMMGTSLYLLTPVIQIASLTGVWGVDWLALFMNAAGAELVLAAEERKKLPGPPPGGTPGRIHVRIALSASIAGLVLAVTVAGGLVSMGRQERLAGTAAAAAGNVTIALVQQNTDPRKDDYEKSFKVLRDLTDQAAAGDPDLIVWSETAFVPNIRRWGEMAPEAHPYADLVHRFRDYQRELGRWLLTGNDDYETVKTVEGAAADGTGGITVTERKDYNAAVFFSDTGERMETYRKIRLVPFTESFPYRETFPRIYRFLLDFDVYLWEPGTERVVFRHPEIPFSTPICFEDSFPGEVRKFVDAGAWAIINISNDFWSLTEAEAEQHLSNALFRAVENRCPLLRASASGVTCHVDSAGRILERLPCYTEGYILCTVPVREPPLTLYRRWGDWFPWLCGFVVILTCAIYASRKIRVKGFHR